jgi:hypothetical protein
VCSALEHTGTVQRRWWVLAELKKELDRLHELLRPMLVEVEMAIDTGTYPDWSVVKTNLLESLEVVRKLERDQVWRLIRK